MKRSIWLILVLALFAVMLPAQAQTESITTSFNSNNSFAGAMFDVSVTETICIQSFDVNLDPAGRSSTLSVFYRPGTYVGGESSSAGWTQMGSAVVNSQGLNIPTPLPVGGLQINAGESYGLYVTVTSYLGGASASMSYTNGSDVFSNGTVTITTGIGKGNPDFIGATFNPRSWNGTIYYTLGSCTAGEGETEVQSIGVRPAFFDGRINDFDKGNPVVLYAVNYGADGMGLHVYDARETRMFLEVTPAQIAAVGECPAENTLIAEDTASGVALYRLGEHSDGTCPFQLNAPTGEPFKVYIIIFDNLFVGTYYESYETFIGN